MFPVLKAVFVQTITDDKNTIGLHSLVNSHFRCITSRDIQDLASINNNSNYAFSLVFAVFFFNYDDLLRVWV